MHSFVTTTSRKRLIYIILKYLFFANSQDVQIILDAINTHDRVAGLKINKDEPKLLVVFRKDPERINIARRWQSNRLPQYRYIGYPGDLKIMF